MDKSDRSFQIITYLLRCSGWTPAAEIAGHLGLSVRTVKYALSDLSSMYPGLLRSSNRGYQISRGEAERILAGSSDLSIPQNYEERKRTLILILLLEQKKLSLDELSERLCISPVTLQNELSRIRRELSPYHLNVRTRKNSISITGLPKDKQAIVLDLINDEIQDSHFSMERIQAVFVHVDLKRIEKCVTSVLMRHEYFLDSYSLLNYVLHLALTIELRGNISGRPAQDMEIPLPPAEMAQIEEGLVYVDIVTPHIQQLVQEIYEKLQEIYQADYTLFDIYQSSVLMITRLAVSPADSIQYDQIKSVLGKDISDLLDEILVSVEQTYCIDMRNENFLIRFAFHLKNLLLRLKHHIPLESLQLDQVKRDYPLIYAIAVHISNIIYQHTGCILPENEISYIALHVGVLMEENRALREKINAIIVCTDYYSLGKRIFNKLSGIFSDSLLFSNILTALPPDEDLANVDLILSTRPVDTALSVPQYTLDPFVTENDVRAIFALIEEIKKEKMEQIFLNKIKYFFHEDLFFYNQPYETDVDAIEAICDVMISRYYVDENYKEQIYAHEKISPSSYGNIAVPHPLNNNASSSAIAISLNPKPVAWGNNQVNLVFMLSLCEEDKDSFSDIFEFITRILKDDAIFQRIINVKSFHEFIHVLLSLYS